MECFFFQAEDGIRDGTVTGVQTCALPILNIAQNGAFALDNYNRLTLKPILHLCKRVPDVTMIEFGERVHSRNLKSKIRRRSEERRVGKECRYRWSKYHEKKTNNSSRQD